ncbi:hypothetical protein F2Q70_00003517 [Brassica cretica]|uniref:Uncharacterized protein n=1 Tax=Brassica cretica TaxID=69181 RepID=A0A8S9ISL9_BRACR|nr:hypothetical protein F2Q70_00003517 [Brassica cretica]KAF3568479.1 hypothetical protein DY000_02015419 [Brassica cretica]
MSQTMNIYLYASQDQAMHVCFARCATQERIRLALFQSLVFVVARFWSKDAVAGRTSARKVSPSDQGSNPGGGGSYSSIDAGLSPGDGGLLSSVAAGCVAGKGRLTQLCRRWLLFPKGGSSQSSALSAWYPSSMAMTITRKESKFCRLWIHSRVGDWVIRMSSRCVRLMLSVEGSPLVKVCAALSSDVAPC